MTPTAFRLLIVLALLSPSALTVAAENPLSTYTITLTDLLKVFSKLNAAIADQMKENDRYVLAKWMLNLSSGFYGLMNAKEVECVSAQLNDRGARIGALLEIDGASVESKLRRGLEEKVVDLKKVVRDMGMEPSAADGLALRATIEADGEKARQTAEQLYKMTAEFAHLLDPTVIPPEHPGPCIKPSPG